MKFQEQVNQIRDLLAAASDVLVVFSKSPNLDSIAAGLAIFLGLKKQGKRVAIYSQDKIRVEFSNLVGVDKISDGLGGKNFVISLDYKEGAIDKVSYNIEGDKFNLVIESRPDGPQLSSDNVHYSYSGTVADLIFVIDAANLTDLGKIYEEKKDLFPREKIVNVGRDQTGEKFGKINLIIPQAASTAEIITLLLKGLGIKLDQDIATNLLAGIVFASKNFTSATTNATTFEAAALSLRAGGKKPFPAQPTGQPQLQPQPQPQPQPIPVVIPGEKKPSPTKLKEDKEEKAPPDWLKPKIYKGSTLL